MMTTADSTTPRYNCGGKKPMMCVKIFHKAPTGFISRIAETPILSFSYIIICRFVLHRSLNTIGQETEDGAGPKQHGETTEHLEGKWKKK